MGDSGNKHIHQANRDSWNRATVAHNSHKRDQAGFLRGGGSTLFPEEVEVLGDVGGRRLVHLQCNSGQDTLSIARQGAVATGVDISDEAIEFASRLSVESGIRATFHRADVYDWFDTARARGDRFDIVFCSYGAICWLSDLDRWAAGVNAVLATGGRLVMVDFHPVSMMFNERFELTYPYLGEGKPQHWEDGVGDYVALSGPALTPSGFEAGVADFRNPKPAYEFQWHMGAILNALLRTGLRIELLREYPYSNGARLFDNMREEAGRRMFPPTGAPAVPLMFGLVAVRSATA